MNNKLKISIKSYDLYTTYQIKLLQKQKTALKHQKAILANQKTLQKNHAKIKAN